MAGSIEGRLIAGRYRIDKLIGSGAMSLVYAALDLRLSRQVAIKFMRPTHSAELTERLFREAKTAARANHPAVVTVFNYGTDLDTQLNYIVMELLRGEDLATRLERETRLPVEAVLRIGSEIADVLAHLHQIRVIHRDLKPANIFLVQRGLRGEECKLLDFGVARELDLQSLTASGEVIGTLAYMAPEQIDSASQVDARSDIYALGVVLFECLVGERPYRAASIAEHASLVLTSKAPMLDERSAMLPAPLMQVVMRCLQREPSARFASARELCDALLSIGRPQLPDTSRSK